MYNTSCCLETITFLKPWENESWCLSLFYPQVGPKLLGEALGEDCGMMCQDWWWEHLCLVVDFCCVSHYLWLLNSGECFLFLQLLTGTVSSLEDHGYVVDIGVSGARAFLPLQKAQEYIRQKNKGEGRKRALCMVGRRCMWGWCVNTIWWIKWQNGDSKGCWQISKMIVNPSR